jgi:hypothetical protein
MPLFRTLSQYRLKGVFDSLGRLYVDLLKFQIAVFFLWRVARKRILQGWGRGDLHSGRPLWR